MKREDRRGGREPGRPNSHNIVSPPSPITQPGPLELLRCWWQLSENEHNSAADIRRSL
jgi:hypothetical protein